jgi:fibro-slime domain-containing protein
VGGASTVSFSGGAAGEANTTSNGGKTSIGSGGNASTSVNSGGNSSAAGSSGTPPAIDPNCPPGGGACVTRCGDGIVSGEEACDDSNVNAGDGCSSTCSVEAGFDCAPMAAPEKLTLPMIVRDFDAGGDFEKGGPFALDLTYANQGLLQPILDAAGRPVLATTTGTYNGVAGKDSGIASAASFAQWFNEAAPNSVNRYRKSLVASLALFATEGGARYANRFGNNGDGASDITYKQTTWQFCGGVGNEDHDAAGNAIPCTLCPLDEDPTTPQCDPPYATACQTDPSYIECVKEGTQWRGIYVKAAFDGNPLFYPADSITPASPGSTGQITGNYDPLWPNDPSGKNHNFSFTTETRFWFQYDATKTYRLAFEGDDDAWVFVNKHLAIDVGGIHVAVHGELQFANGTVTTVVTSTSSPAATKVTTKPDLGALQDGGIYEVAVFQAERQTKASSYMLSIGAPFVPVRSACVKR